MKFLKALGLKCNFSKLWVIKSTARDAQECKYLRERYVVDEHFKTRFMTHKAVRIEIIFGITVIQLER